MKSKTKEWKRAWDYILIMMLVCVWLGLSFQYKEPVWANIITISSVVLFIFSADKLSNLMKGVRLGEK